MMEFASVKKILEVRDMDFRSYIQRCKMFEDAMKPKEIMTNSNNSNTNCISVSINVDSSIDRDVNITINL
ncbi:MAG: hypothetical protein ACRDD7_01215 [Peptostreptococcaceae bacterium]